MLQIQLTLLYKQQVKLTYTFSGKCMDLPYPNITKSEVIFAYMLFMNPHNANSISFTQCTMVSDTQTKFQEKEKRKIKNILQVT